MKKILITVLSVVCAVVLSVTAYAETSVVYDMSKSSIVVSGELSDDAVCKEVSVNIFYPGVSADDIVQGKVIDFIAFSTQRPVDSDNTFSIEAEIDGDTGYYTVFYDYEGCPEPKVETIYYVNKEDNKAALQALNDAKNPDEVYYILMENADDLCFDNEFDEIIDLKKVAAKVYEEIKDNPLDTEDYLSGAHIYNRACLFDAIRIGKKIDFDKYADDLGISEYKSYDWYIEYNSDKFKNVMNARLKGKSVNTIDEFEEAFDEAVVTSVVYMPDGSGNVKKIMADFSDEIGILSLTDKETVYKNLSGDEYKSYSDLKNGYNKEVQKISSENKPSGSGGGGRGGRVSGMKTENVPIAGPVDISDMYPNVNYDGTAGNYPDIVVVPWAREAVTELSARGVISGDEKGNFNPEKFVTREEFAKILVLAFELNDKGDALEFSDVSETDWFYSYVKTAYSNRVVSGIGADFGVGLNITRQDMAVMINNAMKIKGKEMSSSSLDYIDNDKIADYAKDAVSKLLNADVIKDVGNGYFNPNGLVTRAHAVKAVYLALK